VSTYVLGIFLFDKTSLLGGLNIAKREIVCQENLSTRSWVCLGTGSAGIGGILGIEVARAGFQ